MSLILCQLKKIINGTTGTRTGMELEHEQLVKGTVTSVNEKLEKKNKMWFIEHLIGTAKRKMIVIKLGIYCKEKIYTQVVLLW